MYDDENNKIFVNYEDLVNEIKTFSISNVVGRYVKLKRSGSGKWLCLCPFHHEKTPSCSIDDRGGFFKCFGCGEGGDVIKFIETIRGFDFKQAIDYLCEILGIDKNKYIKRIKDERRNVFDKQQVFLKTMQVVAEYYKDCLLSNKDAYNYVLNIRNLNEDTVREFYIGYADNDIGKILNFCGQYHVQEEDVESAGILRHGFIKNNGNRDRYLFFRDRIMIPIQNLSGKIVAFGGRVFRYYDNSAKYLNSSENDYFKKGSLLFNLHRAKRFLDRDNVILVVEGYMDVISLWQAGFKTAVAPLGTSITEKHLQTILHFCKAPIFIFDSDVAGQRASMRACEMLIPMLKTGILPRFCTLNCAKDVDEFLQKYSSESLEKQLNNAEDVNIFLLKNKLKQYDIKNPNQKAKLEKELFELINKIDDNILKKNYQDFFKKTLWRMVNFNSNGIKYNNKNITDNTDFNILHCKNVSTIKSNIDMVEKKIIACILKKPFLMENEDFSDNILTKFSKKNRKIIDELLNEQNGSSVYIQKYLPMIDDNSIIDMFNSLLLLYKRFVVSSANISEVIKDAEKRKILEEKKKMLEEQCD